MKSSLLIILFMCIATIGFTQKTQKKKQEVIIRTEYGNIKVRLYGTTPLHSDNFYKLAQSGFYDSTLFHRVIKDFMIQGGDPASKNAQPDQMLGNGDIGYRIPAEINDSLIHKKGALCAARDNNPDKSSSGCQFYIVQGTVYSDSILNLMEKKMNNDRKQKIFMELINKPENRTIKENLIRLQSQNKFDSLQYLIKPFETIVEKEWESKGKFQFSEKQRKAYTTIGGAPHLDGNYTVFGEVTEGFEVIDKIAEVEKNQYDRPKKDILMKMKVIE